MKVLRKIIEIDDEKCTGCGLCLPSCAEGALEIVDGKAKVIKEIYCDGLGACLGDCPEDALKLVEREADEFDEEAVHKHLETMKKETEESQPTLGCGCPSSNLQILDKPMGCDGANKPSEITGKVASELSHWPVQIRLIPPTAPFLKGADLLVAADCVPVAYPTIHRDFMKGRRVMIGCPKFDNPDEYVDKFTEIFKTADIKSITVLLMEVPCCSGLSMIVKKALDASGKKIPYNENVVTLTGTI